MADGKTETQITKGKEGRDKRNGTGGKAEEGTDDEEEGHRAEEGGGSVAFRLFMKRSRVCTCPAVLHAL